VLTIGQAIAKTNDKPSSQKAPVSPPPGLSLGAGHAPSAGSQSQTEIEAVLKAYKQMLDMQKIQKEKELAAKKMEEEKAMYARMLDAIVAKGTHVSSTGINATPTVPSDQGKISDAQLELLISMLKPSTTSSIQTESQVDELLPFLPEGLDNLKHL
jgi:hypothetical protein